MKIKIRFMPPKTAILFVILFLTSMNFMAKFFYFVYLAFFVLLFMRKKIVIHKSALCYLFVCLWMAFYNYFSEGILSSIRCMSGFVFYIVGSNILQHKYKYYYSAGQYYMQIEKNLYIILIALSGGSFVHYMANFFLSLGNNVGRNTLDIWSRMPMAATGQAALACMMSGFAIALVIAPSKKQYRYLGALILGTLFIYNLVLAGRTLPVMMIIILFVAVLYRYKMIAKASKRYKFVLGFILIILILICVYAQNVGGLRDYIQESNLFERLVSISEKHPASDTSRFDRKLEHLADFFKYPLGGSYKRSQYGYAHDLLLDGYDEYGSVALMLLFVVLLNGIKEVYQFCKCSACSAECKIAMLSTYLAILIEFTIEPILAGMPWLFACFCLINGYMKNVNAYIR